MTKRKVVLDEREGRVLVGAMQEGCDPILRNVEGNMENAIAAIPQVLEEAEAKWQASPRNPAYKAPAAPRAQPAAQPAPARTGELPLLAETEEAAPAAQPAAETAPEAEREEAPEAEAPVAEQAVETPAPQEVEQMRPVEATVGEAEPAGSQVKVNLMVEYWLEDGRGPYADVQAAMDGLGLSKGTRPLHNRYDRLSAALKKSIQRKPKS